MRIARCSTRAFGLAFLAFLTVLSGCSASREEPGGGATSDASPPFPDCAHGWWLGLALDCASACPGQPECAVPDCEQTSFLQLGADRVSRMGFLSMSGSRRQFSGIGQIDVSHWRYVDGGIAINERTRTRPGTCNETELWDGTDLWRRADGSLSRGLEASLDGGNWTAARY